MPVPRVECGWFRGDVDAAAAAARAGVAEAGGVEDVVVARGECECEYEWWCEGGC